MAVPAASKSVPLRVGLVAGEASGDTLGADLIHALRRHAPDTQFFGVAGPKMQSAGCESWEPAESLAVMGLFDVLRDLPRLVRLLARIKRMFLTARPDVFIGIDAPDTNLRLARGLHAAGIPTVQYVSPQVWAWRQGRARSIRESVDLVLCLLPFEKRFYDEHGIRAEFVGHPLADAIPENIDRAAARRALGLSVGGAVVALLPGSRRGEVARLAADFAATARWLAAQRPDLKFIAPMASAATRQIFSEVLKRDAPAVTVQLIDGHATTALSAADVVLVASGTASLEAALCKRPMVVVYRLGALSGWIIMKLNLVKSRFFAQPNLLADRRVVGEYFQGQIVPESIGAELLMWLDDTDRRVALEREFSRIHADLRRGAGMRAAQAILELLRTRAPAGPSQ
ncbi:MAG TPA: lipid-A-disaccharide synthase [Steroidobacteraceae bacterium]|jgi:lipid-A-disaccharide synthase|nr:lipid-A-disaccharide synthase [Steroidobacteraceae bacterium]